VGTFVAAIENWLVARLAGVTGWLVGVCRRAWNRLVAIENWLVARLAGPTGWLVGVWGRAWDWRWQLVWAAPLAVAGALIMAEISQLLETLAAKNLFTYSADALTRWPGFAPWDDTDRENAVTAWNAWAGPGEDAVRADKLEWWLMTHIGLDFAVFAPAYVIGLYLLLRWLLNFRAEQGRPGAIPFSLPGITVMVSALLVADWVETGLTCGLVHAKEGGIVAWARAVACLSAVKWLLLAAVLFLGAAVFVVDILPHVLTRGLIRWRFGISGASRSWTRHRVQLVVLAVLAALIALPGGGPLEQVPDIQRAWVHDSLWDSLEDTAGPVLTLVGLCAALWVAGRWALLDLDGEVRERHKARSRLWFFFLLLGVGLVLALVWPVWDLGHHPWPQNAGGLAIPGVVAAIFVLGVFVRGDDPTPRRVQPPSARAKVETIGRALTVIPLVIAGLGLVRAFARPLLLGSLIDTGVCSTSIVMWFGGGVVLTLLIPPLAYHFLKHTEDRLFGTTGDDATDAQLQRRIDLPKSAGTLLLVIACGLGVFTAVDPLTAGAWLRTLGVLSLMLITVVLLGALFIRRAELREPYRAFRALRFRFTPIWLPVLAVLAAQSMLDNAGLYHAVRLRPVEASQKATDTVAPFSAENQFNAWYEQAAACRNGKGSGVIPMVFVAAAGGGIRAAYWTSAAMDRLAAASPCARSYTFALSGVSGGSLGLAAYTLTSWQPAGTKSSDVVHKLAGENALAANIAALLYRDATHAFHGLNHIYDHRIGDRASVFERAWEQTWPGAQGWERELSSATRQNKDTGWRPFLLMNGTDVVSGCRIAVAAHGITGHASADERLRCQKPNIASGEAQFATATVDAAAFNDTANCATLDQGLRMSTAAHLSARFTYVSPSGTMYGCTKEGQKDPPAISSIDGGYLEGSGLAALLELWSAVEPFVAAKNHDVTAKPKDKLSYVVPLVVLLDNHYSVQAPEPKIHPVNELVAPLIGNRARTTAARMATLQQAALVRFTGPPPGTPMQVASPALPTRSFLVAPRTEPQMAAPLGWVLSEMSMQSMRTQLEPRKKTAGDLSGDTSNGQLVARQLPDLIQVLKRPVSLVPTTAVSGP
jgi:hypothetical protein